MVVCIGTIPCVLANNSKAWSVLYRVASHSGGTAASTNGSDEREQARGAGGPPPFLFLFRLVRSILVLPSPFFESEAAAALTLTRSARSTPGRHSPRSRVGPSVKVSSEDLEPDAKGRRRAGSVPATDRREEQARAATQAPAVFSGCRDGWGMRFTAPDPDSDK